MDRGLGEKSKKEAKREKSSSQQEGLGGDPVKDVKSKGGEPCFDVSCKSSCHLFVTVEEQRILGVIEHMGLRLSGEG